MKKFEYCLLQIISVYSSMTFTVVLLYLNVKALYRGCRVKSS